MQQISSDALKYSLNTLPLAVLWIGVMHLDQESLELDLSEVRSTVLDFLLIDQTSIQSIDVVPAKALCCRRISACVLSFKDEGVCVDTHHK